MEQIINEGVYVILDNFEKAEVNNNFLSSLLQIKKILSINFSICVVGVNFNEKLVGQGEGEVVMPMINITMDKENSRFTEDLLQRDLYEKVQRLEEDDFAQKMYEELGLQYVKDISQCFGSIVTDLGLLKHLNW